MKRAVSSARRMARAVFPIEIIAAYSAFDNGGYRVSPRAVLRVTDPAGAVLEAFDSYGAAWTVFAVAAALVTVVTAVCGPAIHRECRAAR